MAFVITPKPTCYRGRTTECGTCGCKSNLWASNSKRLEGRLVCPGNRKYPELHEKLRNKIHLLWEDVLPDIYLEAITIEVLKIKARFRAVPDDVVVDGDRCRLPIPRLD